MGTPSDADMVIEYVDYMVDDFSNADLYTLYTQLVVVTDLLRFLCAALTVIFAFMVFVTVLKVVNNIFKNI